MSFAEHMMKAAKSAISLNALLENTHEIEHGLELLWEDWILESFESTPTLDHFEPSRAEKESSEDYRVFIGNRLNECRSAGAATAHQKAFLRHNRHFAFFEFMGAHEVLDDDTKRSALINLIAHMLKLHVTIRRLEIVSNPSGPKHPSASPKGAAGDAIHEKNLYYLYCRVCDCICTIVGGIDCWLVCKHGGHLNILSRSVSHIGEEDKVESRAEYMERLERVLQEWDSWNSENVSTKAVKSKYWECTGEAETVFGMRRINSDGDNEHPEKGIACNDPYDYVLIPVDAKPHGSDSDRLVIVVRFAPKGAENAEGDGQSQSSTNQAESSKAQINLDDGSLNRDAVLSIRNIMFDRQRMAELLDNDYLSLIRHRRMVTHITPRRSGGKEGNGTNGSKPLEILHISDLHVSDKELLTFEDVKNAFTVIDDQQKPAGKLLKPDLLIITGDIINAASSAAEVEKHYKNAEVLLGHIVKALFSSQNREDEERPYLILQDWAQRIIIVPGNHDYASMNELVAQIDGRRIVSGYPSAALSSTMAKFTYYLDFIRRFLDVDLDELLNDNLYEMREYGALRIRTLGINTSAGASALRTNKVHIEKSERLLERLSSWDDSSTNSSKNVNLLLMHHAPTNKLNYLHDLYYEKAFSCPDLLAEHHKVIDALGELLKAAHEVITEKSKDNLKEEKKKIGDALNELAAKCSSAKCFSEIEEYKKLAEEVTAVVEGKLPKTIEYLNDKIYAAISAMNMTSKDISHNKESVMDIVDAAALQYEDTRILSGHLHTKHKATIDLNTSSVTACSASSKASNIEYYQANKFKHEETKGHKTDKSGNDKVGKPETISFLKMEIKHDESGKRTITCDPYESIRAGNTFKPAQKVNW